MKDSGNKGVNASSGALNVNDNGQLRANDYNDNDNSNNWGRRPSRCGTSISSFFSPSLVLIPCWDERF